MWGCGSPSLYYFMLSVGRSDDYSTLTSLIGTLAAPLINFSPVAPWLCLCLPCCLLQSQHCQVSGCMPGGQLLAEALLQRVPEALAAVMGFKTISTTYLIGSSIVLDTLVRQILPGRWSRNSACVRASALFPSLFCFHLHSLLVKHEWGICKYRNFPLTTQSVELMSNLLLC